ncbi:ABC transporter ATP-binding protein [Paenibacillus terrigena]|uniref:ABC transporter ATP-binding protein n=1 Tax=Paenibacillus terrigena TaxID=369333 RepID=UPI000367D182|nr:ABC transporter ATP-binding protein [Paenibacillus terrigena]
MTSNLQQHSDQGETIIDVQGLRKRYGSFTAVDGIDFQVRRGEIFGLLGPNGAGKTTTMEMIEGLRQPDEGSAKVAGYDTRTDLGKVKTVIGVQLQSTSLFELLKVKEITKMYASFYEHTVPIGPLLASVTLEEKLNDRVKNLSGGQKQRLAIALALVNDPQIVFLDEPTTGLDPQARRTLWDIILKMRDNGKTVVISTHYMDEAQLLCDRICLMDQGKIIALDTPRNLISNMNSESAVEFRIPEELQWNDERKENLLSELQQLSGVRIAEFRKDTYVLYTDDLQQTLTDFIDHCKAQDIQFADLLTRTATLEDVFIHMTGRSLREE